MDKKVYDYDDYRDFLGDTLNSWKLRDKKISFQYCAQKLSTSRSYLKLVVDKKRHVSMDKLSQICNLFKIEDLEKRYLLILFLKNTSSEKSLLKTFTDILTTMKHDFNRDVDYKKHISDSKELIIYQGWLRLALHSLVRIKDFKMDPKWIWEVLKKPKYVSVENIQETLDEMIEEKLIIKDDKSERWEPSEFITSTPSSFSLKPFDSFKIGLERTLELIDDIDNHKPRNFNMLLLALSDGEIERLHKKLFELRDFAISISKSAEPKKNVVLANFNFATLAKSSESP